MINRLLTTLRPFSWLLAITLMVVGAMALIGGPDLPGTVKAQGTQPPRVTSVNVSSFNTSANIQFSTDKAAETRIAYGTTTAYGSFEPAGGAFASGGPGGTSHLLTLLGLNPSTTYHFQIETRNPGETNTATTPDRSFTTASGGSGSGALTITNISVTCIGGNCRVSYRTSAEANVQLRYDLSDRGSFNNYNVGAVGEPAGFYSLLQRSLDISGLNLGITYHYRMQATDRDGQVVTTGNLTFATGADADDRTFTTGACDDGTPIGACSASGAICLPGGILDFDCASICGFTCPGGQSCVSGGGGRGQCVSDPPLTGSPFQCNPAECYDSSSEFRNPSPPGVICYASWPRCSANTVLKVRKDRTCNLWLTCNTSLTTEPTAGQPAENLCLSLSACNSLGPNGQCNRYLPAGQCNNDPLRFCSTDAQCEAGGTCTVLSGADFAQNLRDVEYNTPSQISQIANLSGNVIAGLNWNNVAGLPTINGFLPWQLMRQLGGNAQIVNGDFERNPPGHEGWNAVPLGLASANSIRVSFEDEPNGNNHNHVLTIAPETGNRCSDDVTVACTEDSECGAGGTCSVAINFAGAATDVFQANASEVYFAEARVRSKSGNPALRFQFGYNDYTQFVGNTSPVIATAAWQRVTIGPIQGIFGPTRFAVVLADAATASEFQIDDVQVRPVLQVDTNPTYISPSCRLYPREDAPACDYVDQNGIAYKGWRGYCLEHDSVTGTCLSWWPVDIIKGESNIFGSDIAAGYADRSPLFICLESAGNLNRPDPLTSQTTFTDDGSGNSIVECSDPPNGLCGQDLNYWRAMTTVINRIRSDATSACGDDVEDRGACRSGTQRGICVCDHQPITLNIPATATDQQIHRDEIYFFKTVPQRLDQGYGGMPELYFDDSNNWRNGWTHPVDGNFTTIQLNWDPVDNHLASFTVTLGGRNSGDDDDATGYWVAGLFAMKEACMKLVQVVRSGGDTQVFASRINSDVYTVPTLNYDKQRDLTPFGGALQPEENPEDPTKWLQVLSAEKKNTARFENSTVGQARSGTPYACVGNCSKWVCNLRPEDTNLCTNATTDQTCRDIDINEDGVGDGECIGVNSPPASDKNTQADPSPHDPTLVNDLPYFAQERIRRLFVKSQGVWYWVNGQYVKQAATVGWNPPTEICPIDPATNRPKRPAFPDDYCAIPPTVFCGDTRLCTDGRLAAFLNSPSRQVTVTGGSGTVAIKFNTNADPDQVPLKGFSIDWGDSIDSISYPFAPRNDATKPHIFSHVYVINPGDNECSTNASGRIVCTYPIKIQVQDNWDWCNDATAATPCQPPGSYIETGLTVRVEQ